MLLFSIGISIAYAQEKTVTGTVTDATDGTPLPGVTIMVKGTHTGTSTDVNGKYELRVSDQAVLVFSYVGMKTREIAVAGKNVIHVKLESESKRMEEVVVTAMGISRDKKALGYAVQDVKADELVQAASTDIASALQGKVSGVEIRPSSGMPGASSQITIRGARSFTGNNTPLYVIDGMPVISTADVDTDIAGNGSVSGSDYANRAVDIDPNDIESINILKGQAAAALYGMRASNGVVIITTKSGKGARQGKPEITVNTNVTFDKVSTLPDFQTEFAQGSGGKFSPTASTSWGPRISELPADPAFGGNTDNRYTQQYGRHNGQYYVPQRAAAGLDPWATPRSYDNAKKFFDTGVNWNTNVNIAQSFDKGNYSFSIGNTSSNGIVPSTGLDRYNVKLNANAELSKNFSTGFSGNFVTSKITKQTGANNGIIATVYGAPASYDFKGIPTHIEGDPYTQNTYRGTSGFDGAYWAVNNNEFSERSHRFFGNAFLKYTTKFHTANHKLEAKYQIGTDSYTTNYKDLWGYGHSNGKGQVEKYGYTINETNSLFTLNYDWDILPELNLNLLVGNEFIHNTKNYTYALGSDFNFSGWNHMDNASVYNGSEEYRAKRTVGNFANLSVAYRSMLYLNATVRNDIVSNMPRDSRSFTYPSVSLGFIFTEPEPLKNDILTYGKIRASYAEVGQAGDYYNSFYYTPAYGGGFSSGTPIQYPINGIGAYVPYFKIYDPALKPQNTRSYEFGADLSFLNGLISLNYTYSRQNVKDQIFEVPISASTGYSSMITNGGKIHTNSHEVTLSIHPVKTKNFNWDFAFNFSKIDNYVDKLAPGVTSIMLGGFVDPQVRAGIGDKFPVIYGSSYLRNEAGQIVVGDDGMPQAGDNRVIGQVSPDFRLGFNTTFVCYKFRLSAVLDWKQGGQMYCGTANTLDFYGVTQKSADYRKSESFLFDEPAVKVTARDAAGNPTAYAPNDIRISGEDAFTYFDALSNISEGGIYNSSFIKLRELALSYPVFEKKWLSVTVNVFARNLLLWSEAGNGTDPESSQGNNNMGGAFERFSLPGTSSYGFGLTIKF